MPDMTPDELERFEREQVHHEPRDGEGPASETSDNDSESVPAPITTPVVIRNVD